MGVIVDVHGDTAALESIVHDDTAADADVADAVVDYDIVSVAEIVIAGQQPPQYTTISN